MLFGEINTGLSTDFIEAGERGGCGSERRDNVEETEAEQGH